MKKETVARYLVVLGMFGTSADAVAYLNNLEASELRKVEASVGYYKSLESPKFEPVVLKKRCIIVKDQ